MAYCVPCSMRAILQSDTHSKTENMSNKRKFDNELSLNVFYERERCNNECMYAFSLKSLNSFLSNTIRIIQNGNCFSVHYNRFTQHNHIIIRFDFKNISHDDIQKGFRRRNLALEIFLKNSITVVPVPENVVRFPKIRFQL